MHKLSKKYEKFDTPWLALFQVCYMDTNDCGYHALEDLDVMTEYKPYPEEFLMTDWTDEHPNPQPRLAYEEPPAIEYQRPLSIQYNQPLPLEYNRPLPLEYYGKGGELSKQIECF